MDPRALLISCRRGTWLIPGRVTGCECDLRPVEGYWPGTKEMPGHL